VSFPQKKWCVYAMLHYLPTFTEIRINEQDCREASSLEQESRLSETCYSTRGHNEIPFPTSSYQLQRHSNRNKKCIILPNTMQTYDYSFAASFVSSVPSFAASAGATSPSVLPSAPPSPLLAQYASISSSNFFAATSLFPLFIQ
jgi:hypothetical protein